MTIRINAPGALVVATAVLFTAGCGSSEPAGPSGTHNDLVFERENGSVITFADETTVWCGAWETGEVPVASVHVLVGGVPSGWKVTAVRADVVIGEPIAFPNTFIWDDPRGADMFILDPPNELSTQSSDSSGRITFTELDCSIGGTVAFTIDAIVGSEFGDLPPVSVAGSFSGRVGQPPF